MEILYLKILQQSRQVFTSGSETVTSLSATFLVLLYKIKGKPVLETTQVHPISKLSVDYITLADYMIDIMAIRSRTNKYLYSKVK